LEKEIEDKGIEVPENLAEKSDGGEFDELDKKEKEDESKAKEAEAKK